MPLPHSSLQPLKSWTLGLHPKNIEMKMYTLATSLGNHQPLKHQSTSEHDKLCRHFKAIQGKKHYCSIYCPNIMTKFYLYCSKSRLTFDGHLCFEVLYLLGRQILWTNKTVNQRQKVWCGPVAICFWEMLDTDLSGDQTIYSYMVWSPD